MKYDKKIYDDLCEKLGDGTSESVSSFFKQYPYIDLTYSDDSYYCYGTLLRAAIGHKGNVATTRNAIDHFHNIQLPALRNKTFLTTDEDCELLRTRLIALEQIGEKVIIPTAKPLEKLSTEEIKDIAATAYEELFKSSIRLAVDGENLSEEMTALLAPYLNDKDERDLEGFEADIQIKQEHHGPSASGSDDGEAIPLPPLTQANLDQLPNEVRALGATSPTHAESE